MLNNGRNENLTLHLPWWLRRHTRLRKLRACDVGEAMEGVENELWVGEVTERLENERGSFSYLSVTSPTFPSLHLRHSSFSNPSVALPTSQLILQPFFRFSYVTGSSLTSPGEPPMENTSVKLVGKGIWTLILSNTSPVCNHCATSLGKIYNFIFFNWDNEMLIDPVQST